jgi:6,7-dimethyl-8-ribityllumazine synthase
MPDVLPLPPHDRGHDEGRGLEVVVLVARWYPDVVGRLLDAALATLAAAGVEDDAILVLEVPGAFELPQAASWVARAGLADAVVALGCVIRGQTPHFEYVARAAADGCVRAAQESGIPVAFGVITADTREQADARSGPPEGKGGNKGVEAARAAVAMAIQYRALERRKRS